MTRISSWRERRQAQLFAACSALFAFCLWSGAAWAQVAHPNDVTVRDVEGQLFSGRLVTIDETQLVVTSGAERRQWAPGAVLRADFHERRCFAPRDGSVVYLANGDRLKVRPLRVDAERLAVAWIDFPRLPSLEIPLEAILSAALRLPTSEAARRRLELDLLDRTAQSDIVILDNGDRATGEFTGIDEDAIALRSPVGEVRIARDGIRGVRFNSELISFPESDGQLMLLVSLSDGSRLTARNVRLEPPETLQFETPFGAKLALPLSIVAALQPLNGLATYLSDLEPAESVFTPYLSLDWNLRRDRSVDGGPLLIRGTEFAKGIGLHSASAVTYRLDGRYRLFHAVVGIDDAATEAGNVAVAVELDGRRIFAAESLAKSNSPLALGAIDVSGADRLKVIVDLGAAGDVGDRVNWCDAALVR
jgi:hypothetical protein